MIIINNVKFPKAMYRFLASCVFRSKSVIDLCIYAYYDNGMLTFVTDVSKQNKKEENQTHG